GDPPRDGAGPGFARVARDRPSGEPGRRPAAPAASAELPSRPDDLLLRAGRAAAVDGAPPRARPRRRRARATARGGVARALRGVRRPAGRARAPLARARARLALRRGERAHRAAQPQLPGGGSPADGSANGRLRARQREAVPPRAARRALDPGALPARTSRLGGFGGMSFVGPGVMPAPRQGRRERSYLEVRTRPRTPHREEQRARHSTSDITGPMPPPRPRTPCRWRGPTPEAGA